MPSTVIRHLSYNEQDNTLQIEFVSGIVYQYKNVPKELFTDFKASKIKGIFFNNHIKDKYPFDRIDNRPTLF